MKSGVMTMRGFGAGVLKESKEQARVIPQRLPLFDRRSAGRLHRYQQQR